LARDATFYVANISVGTPAQHLEVIFDTGSGHVLIPHKACKSEACLEHHHYSPWASSTAVDVNNDGKEVQMGNRLAKGQVNRSFAHLEFTQSDLGDGTAKGVLVREHVCMASCKKGRKACADLALLAATEEDYKPFAAMPADGIIGLGLEGLAVGALSSFFPRLLDGSKDMLPEIGFSLGTDGGELIFGGRSPTAALAAPLQWFPVVHPEDGFWEVEILSVRVGSTIIDTCQGGCRGIIDSASSHLGVQANRLEQMKSALATSLHSTMTACGGPDIQFEMQNGFALKLAAEDYSSADCVAELGSLDLQEPTFKGVYSFGTNMLRKYYATFDWEQAQIGFAPQASADSLRMDAGLHAATAEVTV